MFDKFADYMYYLLTSPLKKIQKSKNQWYILMKVLGKRFDDALESVYLAQDQTAVSTCDPSMLQFHAQDRELVRYAGESDENFRVRIANYTEILKLGGTDDGVLLAVRSLGFDDAQIVPAKVYTGDESRWAEFFVVIRLGADEKPAISIEILRKQVRKTKEVGAKDNYSFIYILRAEEVHQAFLRSAAFHLRTSYFWYRRLNGDRKLDGTELMNAVRKKYPFRVSYGQRVESCEQITRLSYLEQHNFKRLDGSKKLDGSKILDAWERKGEL